MNLFSNVGRYFNCHPAAIPTKTPLSSRRPTALGTPPRDCQLDSLHRPDSLDLDQPTRCFSSRQQGGLPPEYRWQAIRCCSYEAVVERGTEVNRTVAAGNVGVAVFDVESGAELEVDA
jgi:hypothetical protein